MSTRATTVYRVLRRAYASHSFDGEGSYLYGGRWSNAGTRLTYTSEHQSLAMLEYFVHIDPDDPPDDLVLAFAEIPDDLSREQITRERLPKNWRETPAPPELARFGDEFVQQAKACLLLVPSVLATSENNWLLNPKHPDIQKMALSEVEALSYDPRIYYAKKRRAKHKLK